MPGAVLSSAHAKRTVLPVRHPYVSWMLTGAAIRPSTPERTESAPAAYPEGVARWTGEWLSGTLAGSGADDVEPPRWPGERLGLPERGAGSAAGGGARVVAPLIGVVLAALSASLFMRADFRGP